MPVSMDWDSPERKIIRVTFMGDWDVDDIHRMITKRNSMMECVNHPVHQILDMTNSTSSPSNLLSVVPRLELPPDKTGSMIFVVNPSKYIMSVGSIVRRLAPRSLDDMHAVDSVEEAYARIKAEHAQAI